MALKKLLYGFFIIEFYTIILILLLCSSFKFSFKAKPNKINSHAANPTSPPLQNTQPAHLGSQQTHLNIIITSSALPHRPLRPLLTHRLIGWSDCHETEAQGHYDDYWSWEKAELEGDNEPDCGWDDRGLPWLDVLVDSY